VELRSIPPDETEPWKIVGMLSDLAGKDESGADEPLREPAASQFWSGLAAQRKGLETPLALAELQRLVHALDRRHASAADRLFSSLVSARASHGGSDAAGTPRLAFSADRLKRAESQEKYVLIDRGNRPLRLFGEPPYEMVQRITRHPDRYRGFEVCETTRRDQLVKDKEGELCAGLLVGDVRKPFLREMLKQSADERRLSELRYQVIRSDDDEHEMRELVGRLQMADEWTGGSGLEDYLDPELRGKPGWLETQGLEEHARSDSGAHMQAARDGQDVVLTIDADLQLAAQDLLAAPQLPNDPKTDDGGCRNPVGAIILLTPDGDVLAAASAPTKWNELRAPGRDQEREFRRERTLERPTFQPPGSVFKPFVAAYALGYLKFDPAQEFVCADFGHGGGGFESMHCLEFHDRSNLRRALTVSCNSYFAQVGALFDTEQSLAMLRKFGFGQPTGIRCFGSTGRSGLIEDSTRIDPRFEKQMTNRSAHLQFGNGLSVVEATPMQVARAMAGIVTGNLPDIRLVKSVGDHEIPQAARSLGIDEASLAYVRSALRDVVDSSEGTARNPLLRPQSLGFSFACKTGSADYRKFSDTSGADQERIARGKMRKHAWVAGWFPAEAPRAVLVVYLHDVAETSSHTAVFLAAEYLHTEAVKAFVARALAEGAR
jgi:cell division protein FtsI/penicillin-binding protein 2